MATRFKPGLAVMGAIAKVIGMEDRPITDIKLAFNVKDVPEITVSILLTADEVDRIESLLKRDV